MKRISRMMVVAVACVALFGLLVSPVLAGTQSGSKTQEFGNSMIGAKTVQNSSISNVNNNKTSSHSNEGYVKIFGSTYKAYGANANSQKNGNNNATAGMTISVVGNTISVSGSITKSYSIVSVGIQLWLGPVPVYVSGGVGLSFTASVGTSYNGSTTTFTDAFSGGLNVSVTAAVGCAVAYIGIEGSASPLTATLNISLSHTSSNVSATVKLSVGATASVKVVAKVGWGWFSVTYKHTIASWSWPYTTWTILSATV